MLNLQYNGLNALVLHFDNHLPSIKQSRSVHLRYLTESNATK